MSPHPFATVPSEFDHKQWRWLAVLFVALLIFLLINGIWYVRDPLMQYYGDWVRLSVLREQGVTLHCAHLRPPGLRGDVFENVPFVLPYPICFDSNDEVRAWLASQGQ